MKRTYTLPDLSEVKVECNDNYVPLYLQSTEGTVEIILLPLDVAARAGRHISKVAAQITAQQQAEKRKEHDEDEV